MWVSVRAPPVLGNVHKPWVGPRYTVVVYAAAHWRSSLDQASGSTERPQVVQQGAAAMKYDAEKVAHKSAHFLHKPGLPPWSGMVCTRAHLALKWRTIGVSTALYGWNVYLMTFR